MPPFEPSGNADVAVPLLVEGDEHLVGVTDKASYARESASGSPERRRPLTRLAASASSLYRRWKLDYISSVVVAVLAVAWISGWIECSTKVEGSKRQSNQPAAVDYGYGYEGPTPSTPIVAGSEALAAATAYARYQDISPLKPPKALETDCFDILEHLGNLSPWRSVNHGLNATPEVPPNCQLEQVQLLHRHGARYPTTGAGPAALAVKLKKATTFREELKFLSEWTYKLGAEILTPFGREQLFNLGTSFRVKYGALLDQASTLSNKRKKPVFRTETQDRMLKSALNFAAGFFGIPYEEQYEQLVTIEWPGFNNTLSPYMTCKNANRRDLTIGPQKMAEWMAIYLKNARNRLNQQLDGIELTLRDVFDMQQMCAYELVALGGSKFCNLFTEDEWRGFEYTLDLQFFYEFSFGQPAQVALGLGWVQEWLARVQQQPLGQFNSTTNATYHTPEAFPLNQALYVDATHDTIISAVVTTLRFASLARSGPLPSTYIPKDRSFVTSKISPFAANLHSQIVTCHDPDHANGAVKQKLVRWILNDGVVPLNHLKGCDDSEQGWCDLQAFITSTRDFLHNVDWAYDCLHSYNLGDDPITDGRPHNRPLDP
ncbi:hypothetical protein OIO90_005478 [Microbotryomycetes sp. JL221]|nr:hypothetical protein OIO90_005478 [Microbotryomycetes sp. JL221]